MQEISIEELTKGKKVSFKDCLLHFSPHTCLPAVLLSQYLHSAFFTLCTSTQPQHACCSAAQHLRQGLQGIQCSVTRLSITAMQVIMLAVPGAFTPTCSLKHLPGFVEKYDELKAKGVGTIACVGVNDAFVMDAWGKSIDVGDKILLLADGSAIFTKVGAMTLPCI